MTARTWNPGDPEPVDHPSLVDREEVTWLLDDQDEFDIPSYARQKVTVHPSPDGGAGVGFGSPVGLTCEEITAEYGPLREATEDEAGSFEVSWPA